MRCKPAFFGLKELPVIELDKDIFEELAVKSSSLGFTVPGVQKKLSLHLSDEGFARLTIANHPSGYILKPQTEEFEQLPEAEDLVMDIAGMMGVKTVPHGLIKASGQDAYITKRIDRTGDELYAMEDFCQLSDRLTQDKYRGSYERCAAIIKEYSSRTGFDLTEFYLRLLVCFVTGNSDMHLKNFSLIEKTPGKRDYVLSPAYDLLPVNVVMPEDKEETALTLNGRKAKLKRKDFLELAKTIGLSEKVAANLIDSVTDKADEAIEMCRASNLNDDMKERLTDLIRERSNKLAL